MKWSDLLRASKCVILGGVCLCGAQTAFGQYLGPEDTVIAIDLDAMFVGPQNNGRYPAAENPPKLLDGLAGTKYLNFGEEGSGFIVTPALTSFVDGFQITTANDAPSRDPSSWQLYGFNGALTTTDSGPSPAINQTGLAEAWTLIGSGALSLPGDPAIGNDQRGVLGPMVSVNSVTPFQHYKMMFPTVKNSALANSMQIADIQFFTDEGNPASGFLASTDPIIAVDDVPTPATFTGSSFPANEIPARAVDQNPSTKYLNFGEERSGIIVTNSDGPVVVRTLGLTTANDAPERDPASFELYGTNDPITSTQNSNSNGTEVWTLIAAGSLNLPDTRGEETLIDVGFNSAYSSYRLIFPTVKNATAANSMQIADIQLYLAVPEPSATLLAGGALLVLRRRVRSR